MLGRGLLSEIMSDSPDTSVFLGWMQAIECMVVRCIGEATPFSRFISRCRNLYCVTTANNSYVRAISPCFCLTSKAAVANGLHKPRPPALCLKCEHVFGLPVHIFCLCCLSLLYTCQEGSGAWMSVLILQVQPPTKGVKILGHILHPAITQVGNFEGSELFSGPSGFQFWLSWAVASHSLGQSSRTLSASWDELPVELPTCKSLYQALIARESQTKTLMLHVSTRNSKSVLTHEIGMLEST